MRYIKVDTYEEMSKLAAEMIAGQLEEKPDSVLGLATGSTPLGTYRCLKKMYQIGRISFAKAFSVNLDEYVGLSSENEQSYRYYMNANFFSEIDIRKENTFVPDGCCSDCEKECANYDKRITELNGIDIQLLGIGNDGHIGFNEPDKVFIKETHVVELDESTIQANARFFTHLNDVPRKAITLGMGGIMHAKKVVLIANGKGKEEIVHRAFFGPITPEVPASILQLHPDATVIYAKE